MAARRCDRLLARVNFPPYSVKMLSSRFVLVAGGGGKARSGISNVVEIYELHYDGVRCCATPASRFEIGESACMNCAAWCTGNDYTVAAGLDGNCQIYTLRCKVVSSEGQKTKKTTNEDIAGACTSRQLKQRRRSSRTGKVNDVNTVENPEVLNDVGKTSKLKEDADQNDNCVTATLGFDLKSGHCFQTDFPVKDEPYQKVVRISPDFKFLVTGGSDGHIRVWQFPDLNMSLSIQAHNDDVDDLDIHPLGDKMVSTSRDGHAYVWSLTQEKKLTELKWDSGNLSKYRCRNCRFGVSEKSKAKLFTAHVPVLKQKNAPSCYLVKWDASSFIPEKVQSVGKDLSSLTVSDDGRYVAIGTMTGAVAIYIAFSLQRIYHVADSHSNFVTGLQFLPSAEGSRYIDGNQDASLISISVDNQIKIHHIPQRDTIGLGTFMLLMSVLLICTFVFMSYLDL